MSKKKSILQTKDNKTNLTQIHNEVEMIGELKFSDNLELNCKYSGNINSNTGSILIDESADIKADIISSNIIIKGKIKGSLKALNFLEMYPSTKLYGNIKTKKLKISDGVIFEGKCEMIKD